MSTACLALSACLPACLPACFFWSVGNWLSVIIGEGNADMSGIEDFFAIMTRCIPYSYPQPGTQSTRLIGTIFIIRASAPGVLGVNTLEETYILVNILRTWIVMCIRVLRRGIPERRLHELLAACWCMSIKDVSFFLGLNTLDRHMQKFMSTISTICVSEDQQ